MVSLVEDLEAVPNNKVTNTVAIQHLYAFALNRYKMNLFLFIINDVVLLSTVLVGVSFLKAL